MISWLLAGVLFTENAARRIADVVRRVEGTSGNTATRNRRQQTVHGAWGILGKTNASHAKGAAGDVSIWAGDPGSESDTGFDLEDVYNRFADVGSGKWVWCHHNGKGWYLTAAECD